MTDTTPQEPEQPTAKPASGRTKWLGLASLLALLLAGGYIAYQQFGPRPGQTEPEPAAPLTWQAPVKEDAQTPPASDEKAAAQGTQAQAEPAFPPLPALNESDERAQSDAAEINPAANWPQWLTTEQAIRKFVVFIDNLAEGKIARQHLPIPQPKERFSVIEQDGRLMIDPASYQRYRPHVHTFSQIDTQLAAALYRHYTPLLEAAYGELGYPDRTFHERLMQAFDALLSAPVLSRPPELVRPSVYYRFADPALEQRSALDKQLLRMGPDNTRALQQKVRELKAMLTPSA